MLEAHADMLHQQSSNPRKLYDRPTLQREDLGPIFNYLASDVYRRMEPRPENLSPHKDFPPEYHMVSLLRKTTEEALENYSIPKPARKVVNELLRLKTYYHETYHHLVFQETIVEQLDEGVCSGLVMPLQAYENIKLSRKKNTESTDDMWSFSVGEDPDTYFADVASVMRDRAFQNSMLHLSNVDNGTYGAASSNFSSIGNEGVFQDVTGSSWKLFDDNDYTLLPKIRESLKKSRSEYSDGCPVRRASYPMLGEYALRFARIMDIEPIELQVQGASAIVAGCEVVARCADLLAANVGQEI